MTENLRAEGVNVEKRVERLNRNIVKCMEQCIAKVKAGVKCVEWWTD